MCSQKCVFTNGGQLSSRVVLLTLLPELCVFVMSLVPKSSEVLVKLPLPTHLPLWPVSRMGHVMSSHMYQLSNMLSVYC